MNGAVMSIADDRGQEIEALRELRPLEQKAIDAAIAEFNALRAQIVAQSAAQSTLVGVGLAASGVAAGYAFSNQGDPRALTVIPFLMGILLLVYTGATNRLMLTDRYIRTELWPYLQTNTDLS